VRVKNYSKSAPPSGLNTCCKDNGPDYCQCIL